MFNNFKDNPIAAAYVAMYEKQTPVDELEEAQAVRIKPEKPRHSYSEQPLADILTQAGFVYGKVNSFDDAKYIHPKTGISVLIMRNGAAFAVSSADGGTLLEPSPAREIKPFLKKYGLHESVDELEEAFKAGDVVTVKNANKYDSLAKATVSGTVIGMNKSEVMVKVGTGQMNVDPKDLVKESVDELEEATDLSKVSTDKLKSMWDSHKDEERPSPALAAQLKRISAELSKRGKLKERADWVPEEISDEGVADFMGAAAAAAKKGDKTFKFGDKEYKVTMKKSTADAIDEQSVDESLRQELAAMGVAK